MAMHRRTGPALALASALLLLVACQAVPTTAPTVGPTTAPTDAASLTPGPTTPTQSLPTRDPLSTPDPVATATPTPVPALSLADVDRIGHGFLAAYAYELATGTSTSAIFPYPSMAKPYPATYPIREGGTVTFTYSEPFPYVDGAVVYVLSKSVTDASGTVATDQPTDASASKRWTIRRGDNAVDLAPFLGSYGRGVTGRVDDILAAFGAPQSDETVAGHLGPAEGMGYHERTLQYDGAEFTFMQFDFSDPAGHWMLERAILTNPAYTMERGLSIGMQEAAAVQAYDTGDYAIFRSLADEFDRYAGYAVYDPEMYETVGGQCIHLNIGITNGKVSAFGFFVLLDG